LLPHFKHRRGTHTKRLDPKEIRPKNNWRVDIENPNPGVGDATMHFHMGGTGSTKYYYNWETGQWIAEDGAILPPSIAARIPSSVVNKARHYFGLDLPDAIAGPVDGEEPVRTNALMRHIVAEPPESGARRSLPAELEDLLEAGWREGPGGILLLAPSEEYLNRRATASPHEIGNIEYHNNDFAVPDYDLAVAVEQFASRLAVPGPLMDDDQIDYRMPDGEYPSDISRFLHDMAARSLTFATRALALAGRQALPGAAELKAIVNTGVRGDVLVHGTHITFTTARGSPSRSFDMRWFDDLERFQLEAMAVLTMADSEAKSR
jgi:hypothetical protein